MRIVILNYRKAKSKDIPCCCCKYSGAPLLHQNQKRVRCLYKGRNSIVGSKMTCDKAKRFVVPF